MPRIGFFRGKNGSALTWFVNPAKGFFMADSLKLSDFLHGIWNKRRKNAEALVCLPIRRKPSNGAGCATNDGNMQPRRDTAAGQQN